MYHGNHDASMKESYATKGGGGKKISATLLSEGGGHGRGGITVLDHNPNTHSALNAAPCGPYAHMMGYEGDGGMNGDASAKHRGSTYYFK